MIGQADIRPAQKAAVDLIVSPEPATVGGRKQLVATARLQTALPLDERVVHG